MVSDTNHGTKDVSSTVLDLIVEENIQEFLSLLKRHNAELRKELEAISKAKKSIGQSEKSVF